MVRLTRERVEAPSKNQRYKKWNSFFISVFLVSFFLVGAQNTFAAGFTDSATGNWNNGPTWGKAACPCTEGVQYPGPNDSATISSHTVTLSANQNAGSTTISATGVLNLGTYTLNVYNNFANTGTLNANTGTVNFAGANQFITGTSTFYNLTKATTTADTLTFGLSTTTVTNNLNLSGAAGNLLTLQGSEYNYVSQVGTSSYIGGVLTLPAYVANDSAGNVYVTSGTRVEKFDSSGNFVMQFGGIGSGSGQLASSPNSIAIATTSGNMYVMDKSNNRIVKFDSSGNYVTAWGSSGATAGKIGSGAAGIAVDAGEQYIYVADSGNHRVDVFSATTTVFIRAFGWNVISTSGVLQTCTTATGCQSGLSGSGVGQFGTSIYGIAVGTSTIYVADSSNNKLQLFDLNGNFIASSTGSTGANFSSPYGVSVDYLGNIYVMESSRVQEFASTTAFVQKWGSSGSGNSQFLSAEGISVDSSGNIYVADTNNQRIQKFNSSGTFVNKFGVSPSGNGTIYAPGGIAVDTSGNFYEYDGGNTRIQKFDSSGNYVTKWGSNGSGNGQFSGNYSNQIALDPTGNYIFVSDLGNNRIEELAATTTATTFIRAWGSAGSLGGQFGSLGLKYLAVDPSGNVYAVDLGNYRFQKFDSSGNFIYAVGYGVATLASTSEVCTVSSSCHVGFHGANTGELGSGMGGLAVDPTGSYVYVNDGNNRILIYDSNGNYLSSFGSTGSGNGQLNNGTANGISAGITTDSLGNIYVADNGNYRIEKFNSSGNYLTQWGSNGVNNGNLYLPGNVAVDSSGNAYTTESALSRVQKFHTLWKILPNGNTTVSYASVKDSYNASSTAITCSNCTNGGNNTNWSFPSSTVPDAPTVVTAATSSPSQATISFTAGSNGGSSILYYLASSTPDSITATSSASPIIVTGLTNSTSYTFQVYAVNAVGTSSASLASNAVIPKATTVSPTASTTNASSISTSTVLLNGTISSDGGASITARGFAYGLTATYGATTTESGSSLGTGSFSTTTSGLTPNTTYHFQSFATNSIGTSYGGDLTFTTSKYSVPDAPTGVTAATTTMYGQATINFTPPASNGSSILYYVASSSPGGIIATSTSAPINVNGLTNGVSYTFTVAAVNALGTSTMSAASSPVTPNVTTTPYYPIYLIVTGTTTPDATGIYAPVGTYNGVTEYARQSDSAFYIFLNATGLWSSQWDVASLPPTSSWSSSPYWYLNGTRPVGTAGSPHSGASGTMNIAVYDPNNPNGTPVLQAITTPATPPQYATKVLVTDYSGTLSPDASGVYDLQVSTYNGLPIWTREGDGAYSIWCFNTQYNKWRISVAPGNTTAGSWNFDYETVGQSGTNSETDSTGTTTYTGAASIINNDPNFLTPDQYLSTVTPPVFKTGNTLVPLTRDGWSVSYAMSKVLADWGYSLDFGLDNSSFVANLTNPASRQAELVALAQSNPTKYKLSVLISSEFIQNAPDSAYDHDNTGTLISPKTWSPEVPANVLSAIAASTTYSLQQINNLVPIAITMTDGEGFGMNVSGFANTQWQQDPAVVSAETGFSSLCDYVSERHTYQQMFFTNGAHTVNSTAPYIYYTSGGNMNRTANGWCSWDFDYKYFQPVSDIPSNQAYYKSANNGWTDPDGDDALTQALNAVGYASSFGKPLSYNWVTSGWNLVATSTSNSDTGLYYGFLKSYYTAGMIGGNAGYYSNPAGGFNIMLDPNAPPDWIKQMEALGQVHAEFGYLEDMERNGDLLLGSSGMGNRYEPSQPAYEFWTGFYNDRVLARKLDGKKRWLISAWAADAIPRTVSVTIPTLGTISVLAQPAGSLYDARIVGGVQSLTLIDNGSMSPTVPSGLVLPSSTPDSDGAPYPTVALSTTATNSTAKIGDSITLTSTPSNLYASASSTKFLANNALLDFDAYQSSSYTWTPSAPGTYSVVAVVGDTAGNYVSSSPTNITVDALDTTPPIVSVTAPTVGATVAGSSVTLSASSSDPTSPTGQITSGMAGVQFMLDGTTNIGSLVTSTSSPNTYSTTWDSTGITSYGSHTIYAVASDVAGNYATSTVTVNVDNVAPTLVSAVHNSDTQITVTLSKLASSTTITKSNDGGFTVTKTGTGTTYAVTSIASSSGNSVVLTVGSMTAAGATGVVVTYSHSGNGTVADTLGNLLATDDTGITIPPWNTVNPTITNITSTVSDGAYKLGSPIDIDLTFSKTVTTSGNITVTLNTGGFCIFSGITDSTAASCTYTVGSGENSNALNVSSVSGPGTITSTDGNLMTSFVPALNLSANKNIVVDTTAPSVSLTTPSNGATVSGNSITLTASNSDNGSGIASVQFVLDNATNIGFSGSTNPYSITWDSATASNASHTLSAVAKDAAGNYATSSATVTVHNTAPGVPTSVTATAGDAQASISFLAPVDNGGATITGYTVISNPSGGTDGNAGTTALTHTITGLVNNTPYTFTVTATNANGTSNPSDPSNQVTPIASVIPTYAIGGTVSGLSGTLVLQNNSGDNKSISGNGLFTFAASLHNGDAYSVTVLTQPADQTCSVTSGLGSVGTQDISSVSVTCTTNPVTPTLTPTPPVTTSYSSSGGGSASSQVNNLIAMGNYTLAQSIAKQYGLTIPTQNIPKTTPTGSGTAFTRTLKLGMTNSDVKKLQIFLNAQGFIVSKKGAGSPGHETTTFGPATKAALMKFQLAHKKETLDPQGLKAPTGFFGMDTMKAVNKLTK